MQPYVFDNSGLQIRARFHWLCAMFDEGTIRHLRARGIGPGWRCLEVAAGSGSIAAWMSGRVGPRGSVVATDVDTRHLASLSLPGLEMLQHDIQRDPLPEREFDLVHARLLLMHLRERDRVLDKLIASLKPGGWLVVEDFDALSMLPDADICPHEVRLKTSRALRQVMENCGVDLRTGRLHCGKLLDRGLSEVAAEGAVSAWTGGSAGSQFLRTSYEQLKAAILATGIVSNEEFEHDLARLSQNDFLAPSPVLWTAWGRLLEEKK